MSNWYYTQNDEPVGPISAQQTQATFPLRCDHRRQPCLEIRHGTMEALCGGEGADRDSAAAPNLAATAVSSR